MQPHRPWDLPSELSERELTAQQPGARALLITRLEQTYLYCQDNMGAVDGDRPDPRFAELSVRVIDRLMKLYRLEAKPVEQAEQTDPGEDAARTRLIVAQQLSELAGRGGAG